uniref:Uncharacterized protein n=1 Tax=Glossina palpalis gambiensis TaxID=67801 RepID=A0A1B0BV97_9MUSC
MSGAIRFALESNWFGDKCPEIEVSTTRNNLITNDEIKNMQLNLGKLDQDCLERLFYEQLKIVRNKFKSSKSIYETKKFFSKLMSWKIVRGKFDEDDEFLVDNYIDEIELENYYTNCADASFPIIPDVTEKEQTEQAAKHFFTERVVDRYFKLTNDCLKCSNVMMKEDKPTAEYYPLNTFEWPFASLITYKSKHINRLQSMQNDLKTRQLVNILLGNFTLNDHKDNNDNVDDDDDDDDDEDDDDDVDVFCFSPFLASLAIYSLPFIVRLRNKDPPLNSPCRTKGNFNSIQRQQH